MASGDSSLPTEDGDSEDEMWVDEEGEWEETEEGWQAGPAQCLFCEAVLDSPEAVFTHCHQEHHFSVAGACREWRLDSILYIKLINFIRKTSPSVTELRQCARVTRPWTDDSFMHPVNPDDSLLQYDIEEMSFTDQDVAFPGLPDEGGEEEKQVVLTASQYAALQERLSQAEARSQHLEEALQRALSDIEDMRATAKELLYDSQDSGPPTMATVQHLREDEDEAYFSSYADFGIHHEMLSDRVRTESYRDFMYRNPGLFEGKVVLDVGCGTGILSMFAAKAGAKQVIGVDQSDIIYRAMDIVRENKLDDKVSLLRGRLEDITLPVDKVDIVVSEWMGYLLLYESMLDTVLLARDRHLAPGGCVYPDRCNMSLVGLSDEALHCKHITFWDDQDGFKMSCMKTEVLKTASVAVVDKAKVVTEPFVIKELGIMGCTVEDLQFSSQFCLTFLKDAELTAIVGYFDIFFEKGCQTQISFSTGPHCTPTHWKQTVFHMKKPVAFKKGDVVQGSFAYKRNPKDVRGALVELQVPGVIHATLAL